MTFSSKQVPRAEQLNAMLRQTIQPYASAAARDTALAAVLKEGMLTYLEDTNTLTMYDGAAWVTVALTGSVDAGSLTGATLAAGVTASSLTSVGTLASLDVAGDLTVDTDTLHVDSTLNRVGIGTTTVTAGHIMETRGALLLSSTTGFGNSHFPFTDGRFIYTSDPETGGTGDHVFRTYSTGAYVEQLRILENGDVGIGTTAPDANLEITKNTSTLVFSSSPNKTNRYRFDANMTDSADFGFSLGHWTGSAWVRDMTLDSSGYVGIGDTSPQSQIDVKSTTARAFHFHRKQDVAANSVIGGIVQIGADADATNPDTGDYWILFRRGNGSTIGSVRGTGGASVNFSTTSDATLKTDNGLVDEGRVGSIIDALQIHDFDWNEGTVTNQIGVFAQEAIDVLPESIVAAPGEDEDGNYMPAGLDYSKIVPILIAECQFLRQRVAALEAT